MKRILLVDDSPASRNLLAAVLETTGHAVLQATSGEEAVALVARESPDLVITDIVMPSVDGFELVSRLRADPGNASLPIVFYTGVKHEREARALARTCGITHLITKPGDPETILSVVAAALSLPPPDALISGSIDRDVLRLLSDELSDVMADRESSFLRMAGLIEIGRLLSSHRDPGQLLQTFCAMARDILGARVAAVGVRRTEHSCAELYTVGIDPDTRSSFVVEPRAGVLRRLLEYDGAVRSHGLDAEPSGLGLPDSHPYLTAFLGVPIVTREAIHGWFYVGHMTLDAQFTDEDERLAITLGRQLAVAYENARLYSQLQQEFARAQSEVEERRRAEAELKVRVRQLATVEQLSERAMAGAEWGHLLHETAQRLQHTLDADCANILEVLSDGRRLALVASSTRNGDGPVAGRRLVVDVDPPAAHTLTAAEPIIAGTGEARFVIPQLRDVSMGNAMSVAIHGQPQAFGMICVHRSEDLAFSERDSQFLQSVANLLASCAERKRTEERLLSSHQQLRDLASRLQSIREDERTHVAREIHDELGQSLTALKIELSFIRKSLAREGLEHLEPKMRSVSELIDQTMHQVRKLSTELRPGVLDHLGLVAAVEWQAEEFKNRTGIECEVDSELNDQGLSDERCTGLFRILQETLTNVARHANATRVSVHLRQEDGNLVLEIQDNGKGFDNEGARFSSLGLLGMRERALLLGGELYIASVPGKGSKIAVKIPFEGSGGTALPDVGVK